MEEVAKTVPIEEVPVIIDHSPPNGIKTDRKSSDYPSAIHNVIYRIGNFNYKEYLKKIIHEYDEDDLNLPHLDPYIL